MEEAKKEQEEIIFRSKLPDIYIPDHLPLTTYCFQNLNRFKHRPCLINAADGKILSYADVELTVRKVRTGLHNLRIKKADVIMLLLRNSPEFVLIYLGAAMGGVITTTANPFCTSQEIAKQAISSKVKLILTHSIYVYKVRGFAEEHDVKIMTVDTETDGCLYITELTQSDENGAAEVEIGPDNVVLLPYSFGITGLAKGVMVTHKGQVTSIAQQVDGENPNLYMLENDVLLFFMPLFHIHWLTMLLCGLRVGATLLIMHKFDTSTMMKLIEKYKVTIAPLVPSVILRISKYEDLRKHNPSSVRMIISAGVPLSTHLENVIKATLPNAIVGQGYETTETNLISLSLAFAKEPFDVKPGSCGTVLRNAEIKIICLQTGTSLPSNQSGEICIRGDQVMKGYLNDLKSTRDIKDEKQWLHTGDIGYVDDDNELFIVDRIKELIKYKGFQVAPAELESILGSHSEIADAFVTSVKHESDGEVPVAFVVRSEGSSISEDEIRQYVAVRVSFYKKLHRVFFIDVVPKSASGMLLRKTARLKLSSYILE